MRIICESLHGSLTSIFYLLKGRSNHSHCFTCTDVSYFVAERFCLSFAVTAWDRCLGSCSGSILSVRASAGLC